MSPWNVPVHSVTANHAWRSRCTATFGVEAEPLDRGQVVDRATVDELHREHPPSRRPGERAGDDHAVGADELDHRPEPVHRARLVAEVELLAQLLGQPGHRVR